MRRIELRELRFSVLLAPPNALSMSPCSLPDDLPWSALLEARALLATGATGLVFVHTEHWHCQAAGHPLPSKPKAALLVEVATAEAAAIAAVCATWTFDLDAHGLPRITSPTGAALDPALATAARVYLPVVVGAARARQQGRSFVAGHLTQTLDGRIACENGQSQWIGNPADLTHAHRMRALLDGVLVGTNTALSDDPQLTVRHVDGANPRRIVVSGSGRILQTDRHLHLLQPPGCTVVTDHNLELPTEHPSTQVLQVAGVEGQLPPEAILAALRSQGIQTIYLEGGSNTLSSFLQAGCIDLLQVHIASMVLGSGLPGLQLPTVDHVDQGLRLHMDHALLDGHVLLTCVPHR